MTSFEDWARERRGHFEAAAERALPAGVFPELLQEAMRWSVLGGGKRVRPLLAYAAGELTQAPEPAVDAAALALEFIHSYSLVHDDLPCMDNDSLRHGRASTHAKYGFAEGVLAGDALQAEAFRVLASGAVPGARLQRLVRLLAEGAGARGMCGGQWLDIKATGAGVSGPGLEDLKRLHAMKTGALIRAAVLMGAASGEERLAVPELFEALSRYGSAVGLAFQIVDDILDVTADTATLGKSAGKDREEGKATYVSLLGLDEARRLAAEAGREAAAVLDGLERDPRYAGKTRRLEELARFVVSRGR
ncbi:MAG: polyprenyl synthetase family protein [Mesosutterella sp.]|nr:polyprenyl synthetase family protein [Mesosutterella sp.]